MGERAAHSRGVNGINTAVRSVAVASAVSYDDPMSRVLGLDAKAPTLGALLGFHSRGVALMAAAIALASVVAWMHAVAPEAPSKPDEFEVVREEAPPPPPPTATAEQQPEAKAPPARPAQEAPPPPAPAQAAKVLTAEPKPDEPLDLTGNT